MIVAAGFMYVVEFCADKVPGVDTGWDTIHTFIRIPAGAALAAGAVGDVNLGVELAALIVGGGLAGATHATKAGSRALINTSPEPVSNWTASILEDIAVIGGLWVALNHPVVFIGLLIAFISDDLAAAENLARHQSAGPGHRPVVRSEARTGSRHGQCEYQHRHTEHGRRPQRHRLVSTLLG